MADEPTPCLSARRRVAAGIRALDANHEAISSQSQAPRRDPLQALRELTGALAGVAALVYLTGGLALQLRLGTVRLPSSAAVPQLPREFLISLGLLIVAPAIGLALVAGRATKALGGRRVQHVTAAVAAGVACYLVVGALVVTKDPFPAKVCLLDGGDVVGVFIGETSNRTYLGDVASAHPRRIVSIPQSQVARVVVGGRERQLGGVRCGGRT
jgi:hypothetical protein